jgi:hypothetical protein
VSPFPSSALQGETSGPAFQALLLALLLLILAGILYRRYLTRRS